MTNEIDAQRQATGSRTLLTVLCLAQFMLILDVTVVAVAIPSMQSALHVAPSDIQWVTTAYGITFGGFLVSSGRMADLFGPKRILLWGLLVFTVASAICGAAQEPVTLFVARGLQGVGAAMVSPAALALLTTNFAEGDARNKALGIWGAVASIGGIAGNLVGGVLTDLATWRLIFLVNIPIGLVVLLLIMRKVPADVPRARQRLDLPGAVLLTAAVVSVVTAVSQAAVRGFDPVVGVFAVAGVVLLVAFVLVELKTAEPVLKLSMFRNPNVRYGNITSVVAAGASAGALFFCTLYVQQIIGLTPLQTGLGFIPVLGAIVVISTKAGALVGKFGVRKLIVAAALIVAAGLLLLSFVPVDGSFFVDVLPGLMLVGIGSGLSLAPAMIVSTTGVANEDQGLASGLLSTAQQVGSALGVAALNTVAVAVALGAHGTAQEAATRGYQVGFLTAILAPVIMILCVLVIPKPQPATS
ncbi:MFS transporter [Lentzea sp. NEAU-D13]|uniref:MFS transporter n=1 Tax=Lentzea alba TaxID=2714351 RepID=A0A7C9VZZ3_9PSEU|nr:MFS transporter [Lentzea alba]NGY63138.1 MFS transporter [Lentzea alba]